MSQYFLHLTELYFSSDADAHNEVLHDIQEAEAEALRIALARYFIGPFLDGNWGPRDDYPEVSHPELEAEAE